VMLLCGLAGFLAHSSLCHTGVLFVLATGSLAVWNYPDRGWGKWLSVVAFMGIAWAAGELVRGPVTRARSAEVRAAALEHERAEAARQAVIDERQRIARELHDIIAHSVSVMTVQAGGVRRRLTADQARERESLVAVERTGREALTEMRRLVGLLNEEGTNPSYAPQPGMQALDSLVATMVDAGLPVALSIEGTPRELPPGVDLAAYRIVQEALTNTLKHAGPAHARVHICWGQEDLRIDVTNDGQYDGTSTGYGNAGMRERLRLYGGRLEAGPRQGGGYALRAYLPIGSAL
jgi:signal transduction histidine kinase